jgi:hypothetical protein
VRKLARKRFGESQTLVHLDALLTRARRATERRNELLHALWAHELDGDPVMRSVGSEFRPIPAVRELEEVAGEMARITDEIMEARRSGARATPVRFMWLHTNSSGFSSGA